MKVLVLILISLPQIALASFYAKCTYTGEVQKIERLSTLGVATTGNYSDNTDNYTYVMYVTVKSGTVGAGSHIQKCTKKIVKAIYNKNDGYNVGDSIKISVTQMNSRNGSFSELISTKEL